jgi:hypothetical protein
MWPQITTENRFLKITKEVWPMIEIKKMKFPTRLVLATLLLLWNPLQDSALGQHGGGADMHGGGMAGGPAIQEVSGRVVETMNSGGYTYALVDKGGAKTWVAMPTSRIAVGDEIACRPGMVMNNFTSPSLNRSFEHIVFSGGLTSSSAAGAQEKTTAPDDATDEPKPKPKRPEDWKNF